MNLTLETSGIWLQNSHRTGEIDFWRAETKPCVPQDPGQRSSDPTRDWARFACEWPRVSGGGEDRQWPAAGSEALITTMQQFLPFGGRHHYHHHAYLLPNNREGAQPCPLIENWNKDLLSTGPPIKTRPRFPTASPSHQEASTNLLSFSIRGQTEWKPQSEKANQTDHMDESCLTHWNYEPCHVGQLKTDRLWWRVLTKRGPLEKEMANHFSILALRTPWTVWKGKNI